MPIQNVSADKPWSLPRVLSFLNQKNIKYRVSYFSPSYTEKEIEGELSRLGMGLLKAIPAEVLGKGLILAIIPFPLALDSSKLSHFFHRAKFGI